MLMLAKESPTPGLIHPDSRPKQTKNAKSEYELWKMVTWYGKPIPYSFNLYLAFP